MVAGGWVKTWGWKNMLSRVLCSHEKAVQLNIHLGAFNECGLYLLFLGPAGQITNHRV